MKDCTIAPIDFSNIQDLLYLIEEFVREVIPEKDSNKVRHDYESYFLDNGVSNRLVSFLLYKDAKPIGCIELFRIEHPPMLDTEAYSEGEVMNFYVVKGERNKGYGKVLLDRLFQEATALKIRCLRLNSSPDAERLYERNGFKAPPFKVFMRWSAVQT